MEWNIQKLILIFIACLGSLNQISEGKVLWVGETGEVSFTVAGSPNTVGFTKQVGSATEQLVLWNSEGGVTTPYPERYGMTVEGDVFTLVMFNVSLSDADSYTCFWSLSAGTFSFDQIDVKVFDEPDEPYPSVSQCSPSPRPSDGRDLDHCTVDIANETDTLNLTCFASGFYPNATITWTVAGNERAPVAESWTQNSDGTANMEASIEAELNSKPYVCTITGLPIKGESKSFDVIVQLAEDKESTTIPPMTTDDKDSGGGGGGGSNSVGLWVGIALVVVVGCVVIIVVVYKMWPRIRGGAPGSSKPYSYSGVSKTEKMADRDNELGKPNKSKTTADSDSVDIHDNDDSDVKIVDEKSKKKESRDDDVPEKGGGGDTTADTGRDTGGGHDSGHSGHHSSAHTTDHSSDHTSGHTPSGGGHSTSGHSSSGHSGGGGGHLDSHTTSHHSSGHHGGDSYSGGHSGGHSGGDHGHSDD